MSSHRFAGRLLCILGIAFLGARFAAGAEWVVVTVTGMEPRLFVADKVEDKDGMITLRNAKGIALGAWQKESIAGRAAMLPEDRDTWTVDAIRQQVGELEAFAAKYPVAATAVKPALEEGRRYLKQQEAKAAALEAEKKAQLKKRLDALLAAPTPGRTAPPPLADLESHVAEARALQKELPAESARLDEHLKPWVEIRDAVAAGKKWFEESWKTDEEAEAVLESRRQAERDKIMGKYATMEIPAVVIPAPVMKKIRIGVAAGLSFGVLAIVVLLFWKTSTSTTVHTKTQGNLKLKRSNTLLSVIKAVTLLSAMGLVGIEGFYVYHLWYKAPGAVGLEFEPATSDQFARMVYACSQPERLKAGDVPVEVTLESEVLNQHLAKNLVFKPGEEEGALNRTAWAVEVSPKAIRFQENLQCGERTWTAMYEIVLIEQAGGTLFRNGRVTVDGLPVPNILGGWLWNSFQAEVLQWAKAKQLDTHYTFAGVTKNKLKFNLTTMPTVVPDSEKAVPPRNTPKTQKESESDEAK